jgi:hypothetical protein
MRPHYGSSADQGALTGRPRPHRLDWENLQAKPLNDVNLGHKESRVAFANREVAMKTAYRLSILVAAAASIGAGFLATSHAQIAETERYRPDRPPEATIYRDAGYRGPAVFIGEEKPNLGLAWPVNSIRVPSGRWELCEKTRYRGNCRTVDRDTPMLNNVLRGLTIQSIRPGRWRRWRRLEPEPARQRSGRARQFRRIPYPARGTQLSRTRLRTRVGNRQLRSADRRQLVPLDRLERVGARAYGNDQRAGLSRRRAVRPVGLLRGRRDMKTITLIAAGAAILGSPVARRCRATLAQAMIAAAAPS